MKNVLKVILSFITKKEIYGVVVTLAIAYFIYKTISIFLEETINEGRSNYEKKKRRTITKLFQNITKYIILVSALITILSIYGVNVKGMIAGLGVTATIIGLALQDTFKDIINGIGIITENYFIVGDIVTYNSFTGEVIEFGLKSTKIKNVAGEVMIVANRNILEIKNLSQLDQVVVLTLPLPYEESVEKIEKLINENILPEVGKIENVTKDTTKYLGIDSLGDSSVNYLIQFSCNREKQWQTKRDAYRVILNELSKKGISVPFPQVEVHNVK